MKKIIALAFVLIGFTVLAQTKIKKLPDTFFANWVSSYEENDPAKPEQIYRTAGSKEFPMSRFRPSFEFMKDGKCKWLKLEPNDMQSMADATWSYSKRKQILSITDSQGKLVYKFKLNSIDGQVLKMEMRNLD